MNLLSAIERYRANTLRSFFVKASLRPEHFSARTETQGFTLVELLVVTVVSGFLALVTIPAVVNASFYGAAMTSVGQRGRDIYVAVAAAEYETLKRSSVWPADIPSITNSTEYFRHLFDEKRFGTPA